MTAQAYPLQWPQGRERTKSPQPSKFKTGLNGAINNVTMSLRRFGEDTGRKVQNLVLSSNVTLAAQRPKDAGIACYFVWDGLQVCIAVDRYTKVEDNLQAIHHIVEAERTKMRHGGLAIVRSTFRGFVALPPVDDHAALAAPRWRDVLGVGTTASLQDAQAAYYRLVKTAHPDKGGDADTFNRIVDAWQAARAELSQ